MKVVSWWMRLTLGGKMAALCLVKVLLWMPKVVGLSHTSLALLRLSLAGGATSVIFVATNILCLSGQKYACRENSELLSRQIFLVTKVFVTTGIFLSQQKTCFVRFSRQKLY